MESSDVSAQKDGVTTSWPSRMGQRDAFSAPQSRARARPLSGGVNWNGLGSCVSPLCPFGARGLGVPQFPNIG